MFVGARKLVTNEETGEQTNLTLLEQASLGIDIRTPLTMKDCTRYADALLDDQLVLVSFDKLSPEDRMRSEDYMAGVCYIAGATVAKINDDLMMYAPGKVEVARE